VLDRDQPSYNLALNNTFLIIQVSYSNLSKKILITSFLKTSCSQYLTDFMSLNVSMAAYLFFVISKKFAPDKQNVK